MDRKNLKFVALKNGYVFDGKTIYIQSMLKKNVKDIAGNIEQAIDLQNAGCHIIRVAACDIGDMQLIYSLKEAVFCPIVCDVHFNYKIAIEAANAGADKIRINPGNITKEEELKKIANVCIQKKIPIRIGINSGSLEKEILEKYGGPTSMALVESALKNVELFEKKFDFFNIVVSIKSSNVLDVVKACREFRKKSSYPLHIGVTEAGLKEDSIIKSSVALGSLLIDNIGETLRVSITANPLEEVKVAKEILKSLNLGKKGLEVISCPTCGRTRIDIFNIAEKIKEKFYGCNKNIKVAVMGCAVNGPGEAKDADIGIAGGDGSCVIFKKGKICCKIAEDKILNFLFKEIEKY